MGKLRVKQWLTKIGCVGVVLLSLGVSGKPSLGQTACRPPQPGEYLLLIVSNTPEKRELANEVLPTDIERQVCQYLNDIVTRVGGFDDILIAEDWAAYFQETSGLSAYVVKSDALGSQPQPRPPQRPRPPSNQFDPKPLGAGYAVLVEYFDQPEIAAQAEEFTGKRVALVSYNQRSYLLLEHSTDPNDAVASFQRLNREGFWPMVVDSSRVTILRSSLMMRD